MSVKENIQIVLRTRGRTAQQMEQDLGLAKGYVSKLNSSSPSLNAITAIADYLDASIDFIAGRNEEHIKQAYELPIFDENGNDINPLSSVLGVEKITKDEERLYKSYRALNQEGRDKVLSYISDLNSSGRYIKNHEYGLVEEKSRLVG